MNFTADMMSGLKNGERLVILPEVNLAYFVNSDNNMATTEKLLKYRFERGDLKIGDTVYVASSDNGHINMSVGRISKQYVA